MSTYVDVNPSMDLREKKPEHSVSFIPMESVSIGATGEYVTSVKQLHEVNEGYSRFRNGDILWAKITPSMQNGKSCLVDGLTNGVGFGSTEFHVLRVRDHEISPQFVLEFVSQETLRQVATYAFTGSAGQQRVPATFLENLPFPKLSMTHQNEMVQEMDTMRAELKTKLADADALLAGIDDFVLDALGINPSAPQRSVFAVSALDVHNSRFDSDFHSLRFRTIRNGIERGKYPSKTIGEVCEYITSGFAAGRQNQAFDYEYGIPHIRPLNLDIFGRISLEGTKFVPKSSTAENKLCIQGEVLFNNTNSTDLVGKSAVFDLEQPCACSNHVTRLKPISGIVPEYLASVLNALRRTGYLGLLSTNFNNQAGINKETLSQLHIPNPPVEEQSSIAAEVRRRREEARRLRSEAESGWQEAKRWFEKRLLGE